MAREGFLWYNPTQVTQQAVSTRFLTFPAELFESIFKDLLPHLKSKWQQRKQRPLPESVQFTLSKFEKIWIIDGSTLEALFKKLKSLSEIPQGQLAGKMGVVIDLVTRLPVEIWFQENPKAYDSKFEKVFTDSYSIRDRLIRLGSGTETTPYVTVRLIEVRFDFDIIWDVVHNKLPEPLNKIVDLN